MPAMHLMSTDFPAPLSPASAVTFPAGRSRSTSRSACTATKCLLMPRRRSSGACSPSVSVTVDSLLDPGDGARLLDRGDANGRHLHPLVLDDRGVHVGRRHPLRRE